jgi:hypothetical protein
MAAAQGHAVPALAARHRAYGVTDRQHWFEATGTHLGDG